MFESVFSLFRKVAKLCAYIVESTAKQMAIKASQREKRIVESAADLICSLSVDGIILSVNPACHKISGYSKDELIGKNIRELVTAEDVDRTEKKLTAVTRTPVEFENRIRRKDGSVVPVFWCATYLESDRSIFAVATVVEQAIK